MKILGFITLTISSILVIALIFFSATSKIHFEQNCKGYLKHAADANTVALAKSELRKSVDFIESKQLTHGSTHSFYPTPKCDLGFWYTNLKAAADELEAFPEDAEPLVVSNQLMKLRETLVDQREKGPRVTVPPNITIYPYQLPFELTQLASLSGFIFGFVCLACGCESATPSETASIPENNSTNPSCHGD